MNRILEGRKFLISTNEDGKDTPVAKKDKSVIKNGKNGNGRAVGQRPAEQNNRK